QPLERLLCLSREWEVLTQSKKFEIFTASLTVIALLLQAERQLKSGFRVVWFCRQGIAETHLRSDVVFLLQVKIADIDIPGIFSGCGGVGRRRVGRARLSPADVEYCIEASRRCVFELPPDFLRYGFRLCPLRGQCARIGNRSIGSGLIDGGLLRSG